jgi:tetratricopeptide (TPR) repeat protein
VSARELLAGFAKSVLVHRHAFIPTPAATAAIGRGARFPDDFSTAFGSPAPRDVDRALASGRRTRILAALKDWSRRAPSSWEPLVVEGVFRLWPAPASGPRRGGLEELLDRYSSLQGIRTLRRAVERFPKSGPARLWLALALLRRTDLPGARAELDLLVARERSWSWPRLARSELARVDIRYADALKDIDAAQALAPSAWIHAFRARVMFQMRSNEAGLAELDRAVAQDSEAGWIRAWRGDALRKSGRLPAAKADLLAARSLEPDYERIYLWLGMVELALKRPRAAEKTLSLGLRRCGHFEKAFAQRARARMSLGRVDEALGDVESAARINHRHNAMRNWTAQIETLDPEKLRTLKALAGHAARAPRSARAWGWLGETLIQAGDFETGVRALDRALRLRPRFAWGRAWRGEALMRLGRLREAEADLNVSVRLDPLYGRARAFRGRVRFLRGDARRAVSDFRLAVSDGLVEYSWLYWWRAQAHAALGQSAQATEDVQTAAALDPALAGRPLAGVP